MPTTGGGLTRATRNVIPAWIRFLLWPVVILAVLGMFRDPISDFIRRMSKVEVTKDENSIKVAVIAASLAAAEASRPETQEKRSVEVRDVAATATRVTEAAVLGGAKILWVDDNPDNNRYERDALATLGVQFALARNTEEALGFLNRGHYTLVISDFARHDDSKGGYTLLEEMKKLPFQPPLIIYSSSANPDYEKEAKARGAYGETNSPQRLFDLVLTALAGK